MLEHRLLISGNTLSSCFQWFNPHPHTPNTPLCLHYPPLFGLINNQAWWNRKHKMAPPPPLTKHLGVAWTEGWETMFRCFNAALTPPPPCWLSHITVLKHTLVKCVTSRAPTSTSTVSPGYPPLLQKPPPHPHSPECNRHRADSSNSFREFLFALPRMNRECPPGPGIAN